MAGPANNAIATCLSLTRAIGGTHVLGDIYGVALDALEQGLGVERSSILLFDDDGVMRFKAWRGLSDGYRAAVEGHTPWAPDTPDPQPIVVPDAWEDPSLKDYRPTFDAEGIRALAFIPLVADGRVIGKFMLYYAQPRSLSDEELQLAGVIAAQVAFAVSRMRAEQAKLAAANEATRLKDEFLAVLSHELRTPLNAIVGWVHLLQSGTLDAQATENAIQTIARNARVQARLIEDILDVSRIVTGKLELERQPLSVRSIVCLAMEAIRPAAIEKSIQMNVEFAEVLAPVEGDAKRLQQVFTNLLSNAVKFSAPGGTVAIRCSMVRGEVAIDVKDDGAGIDAAFMPLLFERFRQADSGIARRHGGLGLGLAIVRHLVEAHGGTVSAMSGGTGRGALFSVRLPAASGTFDFADTWPGLRTKMGSKRQSLDGLRVLIVDDEPDARTLVEKLLSEAGANAASAGSAEDALVLLGRAPFDVMVADIAMPGADGYSLVRKAKVARPALTAVALTALARPEDRIRALTSGFDAYESKPVDPPQLIAAIAGSWQQRTQPEARPRAS